MLDAHAVVRKHDFTLDARITCDARELVVIVGPNGAGKTTMLRAIAGLEHLDSGRIAFDGRDHTLTPPHQRGVGLVPQSNALLPHLDALRNVAFGLKHRDEAASWLELVGLSSCAHLKPSKLSGGQAKRVAIARALAVRSRVLLLDEPFEGLDASASREIRRELRRYLDAHDGYRILVTHDPVDALTLADTIVVLEEGHVVQTASPDEIASAPRSPYVAELVGLNLFRGELTLTGLRTGDVEIVVANADVHAGPGFATIHPRAVALHPVRPVGSPRNVWAGQISYVDDEGDRLRVRIDGDVSIVAEITRGSFTEFGLGVGTPVYASVKATEVNAYPA